MATTTTTTSNTNHWHILHKLANDCLLSNVRSFMVIGYDADGVLTVDHVGQAYWHGHFQYGWKNVEIKQSTIPIALANVRQVSSMAHGWNHVVMCTELGQLFTLGMNDEGQLGLGLVDSDHRPDPQPIFSSHKFVSVRCGFDHNIALTDNGKVWAWGGNYSGQVAVHTSVDIQPTPHLVTELNPHRVMAIECGGQHSLALTDQGEVYTWGCNEFKQLGHENCDINSNCSIPARVHFSDPVKSMAAGDSHTLLLTQNGVVYACGGNDAGQLGLPIAICFSGSLTKVTGLPPTIAQIGTHFATKLSIAITTERICYVWGELNIGNSGKFEIQEIPLRLAPIYSTIESPLSFYSRYRNTPHSFLVQGPTPSGCLSSLCRMFDNPNSNPDVQFVVENRPILTHRCFLQSSSAYFDRMFSKPWLIENVDHSSPITRITITEHSYEVFYAYLRFLYTSSLSYSSQAIIVPLFELANFYLETELERHCISTMRSTVSVENCCQYYRLTDRYSTLSQFEMELVRFIATNSILVYESDSYRSMDSNIQQKLTTAIEHINTTLPMILEE